MTNTTFIYIPRDFTIPSQYNWFVIGGYRSFPFGIFVHDDDNEPLEIKGYLRDEGENL